MPLQEPCLGLASPLPVAPIFDLQTLDAFVDLIQVFVGVQIYVESKSNTSNTLLVKIVGVWRYNVTEQ